MIDPAVTLPKRPKILPPIYALLALLVMLALHYLWPVAHIISGSARYVGIVLIGIGLGTASWARVLFNHAGTTIKPYQESSDLVVLGPFRFTRNPMYVSLILVLTGTAVLLGSLTPFLVIPVMAMILDRKFIRVEERMLEEKFGESYRSYKSSVRRWI
jgi:protein-S-isoprenylcysteine O-methyltransferase Ste14